MKYTRVTQYQAAILRSLGLQGRPISRLVITFEYNCLPVVEVTYFDEGKAPDEELPTACAYDLIEHVPGQPSTRKFTLPGAEHVQT